MSKKNNLIVSKSNKLIEGRYKKLTLDEMRILNLTLAFFDPTKEKMGFEIGVRDFCDAYPNIDPKNAYGQVQKAIKNLSSRWVVIVDDDVEFTEVALVHRRSYFKKEGRFYIEFHEDLKPYIADLQHHYTKYQLSKVADFSSINSLRLYELLIQYVALGKRKFIIEDLKNLLNLDNKYKKYAEFKRNILDPSIKEINTKSDIFVDFEPKKKGRGYYTIIFKMKFKDKYNIKLPARPQVKADTNEDRAWRKECLNILNAKFGTDYSLLETDYLKKHALYALPIGSKGSQIELLKRNIRAYLQDGLTKFVKFEPILITEESIQQEQLEKIKYFENKYPDFNEKTEEKMEEFKEAIGEKRSDIIDYIDALLKIKNNKELLNKGKKLFEMYWGKY